MAPEDKHFSSSSVACSGSEWNDPPGTENMREIFQILFLRNCNIAEVPVAGPGSVLFFRYQLFIMVWALVIAGLWAFGLQ